jgi:hypothetical protein
MDINAEINNQKNIIAECMVHRRALKLQRKAISAEIKGWDESMEKASERLELLKNGDVDGYQQTLASATDEKNSEHA